MIANDTERDAEPGRQVGSQAIQTGGKQTRAAAAAAQPGAARPRRRRTSACRSASLTVKQGRRLGRRQDRHLRRADRRQALQRHDPGFNLARHARSQRRLGVGAGSPGTKPVSAVHARRQPEPAADRHPGEGHRHVHLRPQHPRPGHAARPRRAAARPGRLRRRHGPKVLSVDESSIKHIPGAKVVQFGNFLGVVAPQEYDAIQAAAQLKVKWARCRRSRASGTSGGRCATTTRPGKAPARIVGSLGQRRQRVRRRGARRRRRPTRTTTTATCRSARRCAVADVTPDGARSSRTPRTCYGTRGAGQDGARAAPGSNLPAEPDPAHLLRGLEHLRLRRRTTTAPGGGASCPRSPASRCACSSCAGTSTAGTTTARRR